MKLTFSKFVKDGKERGVFSTDTFNLNAFERVTPTGSKQKVLTGTAIVCGPLSDDRGGYQVRIAPGAAQFTPTVLGLYNHDYAMVVGNTDNGTLKLSTDSDGNVVVEEMILPDNDIGERVYVWVRDKYIKGMSFGCIPTEANEYEEDGKRILEYTKMQVDEVTITVIPAFLETSIQVKDNPPDNQPTEVNQPVASPPDVTNAMEGIADFSSDIIRLQKIRLELLNASK